MKVKFSEHQADHFKEQAPVCGSTQSGVCLWAEKQNFKVHEKKSMI